MVYSRGRRFVRRGRKKFGYRNRLRGLGLRRPVYRRFYKRRYGGRARRYRDPFPQRAFYKCKFHDFAVLDTGGANTHHVRSFVGNSIFDPEVAIGGGTPVGLARIQNDHYYYKVVGSAIRVRIHNYVGQNIGDIIVGIRPRGYGDSAPSTYTSVVNHLTENKESRYVTVLSQAAPDRIYKINMFRKSKYMLGPWYNDASAGATTSSNPTSMWYWDVCVAGPTLNTKVNVDYTIVYYVYAWGRKVNNYDI